MRILEQLVKLIRSVSVFNSDIQVTPACILWPDRDRQWETVIPILQTVLPELLILGDYAPDKGTGPAIWLRCIIADKADNALSKERIPIFYTPGVSRQDLRAVESCPEHLKPLAELQYRGVIWSQINAKDWTILAFLKSDQGGLGLDITQDADTKSAMQLALYRLLDENVELLRDKRLDKDYFNTLLMGGDPVKDVLLWLNGSQSFQLWESIEAKAFVEVCKSQLAFNPQQEGVLAGAIKLANHAGPWQGVWERFCEAPQRYPNIPLQIRKCQMPPPDIFADETTFGGWPQWNETGENTLRANLLSLSNELPHSVRNQLRLMEEHHGQRRQLVWAELGEAPLALALEHLLTIAKLTEDSIAVGTLDELSMHYQTAGWKVDDAVLKALALIEKPMDFEAVTAVIRALYLPWLEESARYLQKQVDVSGYPGGNIGTKKETSYPEGQCLLFVDGLRLDAAKRLGELLEHQGLDVAEKAIWTALPSVTATGKAAVSPVKEKIRGEDGNSDFEPSVAATGQSLKGGYHFKKLLLDSGWKLLERSDNSDGQGNAWCEFGDIDHEGHDRGWKLAKHLDSLLKEINERISALLTAGWKSVRVVTDHGWLLLPGGLPKIDLPSSLTENKWGRCVSLKLVHKPLNLP